MFFSKKYQTFIYGDILRFILNFRQIEDIILKYWFQINFK